MRKIIMLMFTLWFTLFLAMVGTSAFSQEDVSYDQIVNELDDSIIMRIYWTQKLGEAVSSGNYEIDTSETKKIKLIGEITIGVTYFDFQTFDLVILGRDMELTISDDLEIMITSKYLVLCKNSHDGFGDYRPIQNAYGILTKYADDPDDEEIRKYLKNVYEL